MWIASEGGIDILDLDTYSPVTLSLPADSPLRQLMDEYVSTVYRDKQGDLWISGNKDFPDITARVEKNHAKVQKLTNENEELEDMKAKAGRQIEEISKFII